MKKLNWKNLIELGVLTWCLALMICDFILLLVTMKSYTWFGLISFIISMFFADLIINDLHEKSIRTYRPKHAANTGCK